MELAKLLEVVSVALTMDNPQARDSVLELAEDYTKKRVELNLAYRAIDLIFDIIDSGAITNGEKITVLKEMGEKKAAIESAKTEEEAQAIMDNDSPEVVAVLKKAREAKAKAREAKANAQAGPAPEPKTPRNKKASAKLEK